MAQQHESFVLFYNILLMFNDVFDDYGVESKIAYV